MILRLKNDITILTLSLVLGFSFASAVVHADQVLPVLESRNMPESCEFVFQVESDIRIDFSTLLAASPQATHFAVHTRYVNAYNETQTHLDEKSWEQLSTETTAQATLMSFQTNQHRLLRKIIFSIEVLDSQNQLLKRWPESQQNYYLSEFGREFGETCRSGRSDTPWRQREISQTQE